RGARIALLRGDAGAGRQRLETAVELPGCELAALGELLAWLRAGDYPAARASSLRDRLRGWLEDPATTTPPGLLTHVVRLQTADEDGQLLLSALERRLAGLDNRGSAVVRDDLVELLTAIADLQQRLHREEPARLALRRLLALAPDDNLRWRAALLDLQLGHWDTAADLLAMMIAAPEAPDYLRELYVSALAHLGRVEEMERQLERLKPADTSIVPALPGNVASHRAALLLAAAWALRDAGKDAEAERLFRRVLAEEPGQREAQLAILHLYATAEERAAQQAAMSTRQALETDPQVLFEEGSDLLGAGDAQGARALLARAAPRLAGSPYAEAAWYNLGVAAAKAEQWEQAAEAFAHAAAANPTRGDSYYRGGLALHALGRCQEAIAALRRALELMPDKRDAHYYLAQCYGKLGDKAAAAREDALFNGRASGGAHR
ncbi:MAG TPA: tetratricopeptide repeat protein, partial [Thermoanaerobaculia bacterium]|nr:tetratricopeptide repeat protein [Thermoanaerobaculia bacterium]